MEDIKASAGLGKKRRALRSTALSFSFAYYHLLVYHLDPPSSYRSRSVLCYMMKEHIHDSDPPDPFEEALKAMKPSQASRRPSIFTSGTPALGIGPQGGTGYYPSNFLQTPHFNDNFLLAHLRLRPKTEAGAGVKPETHYKWSRRKDGTSAFMRLCV